MDNLDQLVLLHYFLTELKPQTSILEGKLRRINECIEIIKSVNLQNAGGYDIDDHSSSATILTLTPEQDTMISSCLTEGIESLPPNKIASMNSQSWNSLVPPCLQISNVPGILACGPGGWSFPPVRNFNVRGPKYLQDNQKVKLTKFH